MYCFTWRTRWRHGRVDPCSLLWGLCGKIRKINRRSLGRPVLAWKYMFLLGGRFGGCDVLGVGGYSLSRVRIYLEGRFGLYSEMCMDL